MATHKRKAPNGAGSTVMRRDGRWMARVTTRDPVTGARKRLCAYGESREEAEDKLTLRVSEVALRERHGRGRKVIAAMRGAAVYGIPAWIEMDDGAIDRMLKHLGCRIEADLKLMSISGSGYDPAVRRLERVERELRPLIGVEAHGSNG